MPIPALVWALGVYLVTTGLSYALSRRAAAAAPRPADPDPGRLEAPPALTSGAVPIAFGSVWLTPNVVWYGGLSTEPIRQCPGGECFVSGYRYLGGVHHALCQGPVDEVLEMQADGRTAWLGPARDGIYHCNAPGLFGGDEGQGGIDGWFAIALGHATQGENAYLKQMLGTHEQQRVAMEVRCESLFLTWPVGVRLDGFDQGGGRTASLELSSTAWTAIPGRWTGLTGLTELYGARTGDLVLRRADTQEELGRLPVGNWWLDLDWSSEWIITLATVPAFRGIVSCIFSSTQWSANSPFWPALRWKVRRTSAFGNWYPWASNIGGGMNAAHILHDLLCADWGLGYPLSATDDVAWRAAADTLAREGCGLHFVWDPQAEDAESFAQTVLDHIDGRLYVHPTTGLWVLDLIRGDYDRALLPVLDATNVVSVERYERLGWDETVNQVEVTYRDLYTGKEETIAVNNRANRTLQGAVVRETRSYLGIGNAALAKRVARRDLRVLSYPMAHATVVTDRLGYDWLPGQVVRWSWPEYGIVDVTYRLAAIDYGTLADGRITLDLIEDVFGLGEDEYAEPVLDQAPVVATAALPALPAACLAEAAIEAPYAALLATFDAASLTALPAGSGFGLLLGARGTAGDVDAGAYVAAVTEYALLGRLLPSPVGWLAQAVSQASAVLPFTRTEDLARVTVGTWALVDDELVAVTEIGESWVRVARGLWDTVPTAHASATPVLFAAPGWVLDRAIRAEAEAPTYFLCPRTGRGELSVADAAPLIPVIAGRLERPYPPGRVRINGIAWPSRLVGDLTLTWAHRDRLTQGAELTTQEATSIGPESGTTYSVVAYHATTEAVLRSWSGLTDPACIYTQAQLLTDAGATGDLPLRLELWAVRAGLASWQRQTRTITVFVTG